MHFVKKLGRSRRGDSDPNGRARGSSVGPHSAALYRQYPTRSSVATKIHLALTSVAMVDALGAPAEFQARSSYPFLSSMQPNNNFGVPAGVWTDDTSTMLCLARSIATYKANPNSSYVGGFNEAHQLDLYSRWHREGFLSAVGRCVGIGSTTERAIAIYTRHRNHITEALTLIRGELGKDSRAGNGSLMRVLPIGLAYWRDIDEAREYAKRSSQTTHPAALCGEACQLWTSLITLAMEKATHTSWRPADSDEPHFSKLNLLEYISRYPFENHELLVRLTLPYGLPSRPDDLKEREAYYVKYHPLLRLIATTQAQAQSHKDKKFPYQIPSVERLPSSKYVLDTLIAALYCFFATRTFEEGALMSVNLGDDADTVGSVYAGLAAVWYAGTEDEAEGIFWTKRVREWNKGLVSPEIIGQVAEDLIGWEGRLAD